MSKKILLGHGSGGRLTHNLIKELVLKKLDNRLLRQLSDSARIGYRDNICFTTDSFVVSPLKFPGGDIGKLAVCGSINDLVVSAAKPEYLSLSLIIEEGLEYGLLEEIVSSISLHAKNANVRIVTGDIKVVEKGACDKLFINTAAIGRVLKHRSSSVANIRSQDVIIFTGNIAQHGMAVLAKRNELGLNFNIKSDCAALNGLIIPVLERTDAIKFMRDPTRGGVATTLNEMSEESGLGILIEESQVPVSRPVRAAGELLGIDPLYVASEGMAIVVVRFDQAKKVLDLLKKHLLGKNARVVGRIVDAPKGKVILNTVLGTQRIVDMLTSEALPRIC